MVCKLRSVLLFSAAMMVSWSVFAATPSFTALTGRAPNPQQIVPLRPVVGDFDGDGHLDILTVDNSGGSLSISYGNADGTAKSSANFPGDSLPGNPYAITAADLDGDGKTDLILGVNGGILYFLNNGANPYDQQPGELISADSMVGVDIKTADLNGDGFPDIIACGKDYGTNTGKVEIFLSTSTTTAGVSTFTGYADPVAFETGADDASRLAVGDLNGDGYPDVVVIAPDAPTDSSQVDSTGGSVTVFYGDPNAVQNSTPLLINRKIVPLTHHPVAVDIGDVNQDGKIDVVTASFNFVQNGATTQVWTFIDVLKNKADSASAPTYDTGSTLFLDAINTSSFPNSDVTVADIDGDAVNEIVTVNSDDAHLRVLRVPANLSTTDPDYHNDSFDTFPLPHLFTLADLNGDGTLDAVVASISSNGIKVLLNTTGSAPPADKTLAFANATYSGTADGSYVTVKVERGTDSTGMVDVAFSIGGTANVSEYTLVSPDTHSLHFDDGVTEASIVLSSNAPLTTAKTVILTLGAITGDAVPGTPATTTVTFNPFVLSGKVVQFAKTGYNAISNGQEFFVEVDRSSDSNGAVDVPITLSGTAKPFIESKPNAACDYILDSPSNKIIHFNAGVTTTAIALGISHATKIPTPKTIIITMGTPTGDAALGTKKTTTVTIRDSVFAVHPANALKAVPDNIVALSKDDKTAKYSTAGRNFSPWNFTTTQSLDQTAAGLSLKLQYIAYTTPPTTPPTAADSHWANLPNGTMTLKGGKGTTWIASVDRLPNGATEQCIYFRTVTSATDSPSANGAALGPVKVVPGPQLVVDGSQALLADASDLHNFTTNPIAIHPSEAMVYRFHYRNLGNAPATNVTLIGAAPTPYTHLGSPLAHSEPNGVTAKTSKLGSENRLVTWTFPSLAAGADDSVFLFVNVAAAAEFNPKRPSDAYGKVIPQGGFYIQAKDQAVDPQIGLQHLAANVVSPLTITVARTLSPDPTFANPGGTITYTLTATNNASYEVTNGTVIDQIPVGTTLETVYDEVSPGSGQFVGAAMLPPTAGTNPALTTLNSNGLQMLTWKLPPMPSKATRNIKFTVRVLYDVPVTVYDDAHTSHTAQIVNNQYQFTAVPPVVVTNPPPKTPAPDPTIPAFTGDIPSSFVNLTPNDAISKPSLGLEKRVLGQNQLPSPIQGLDPYDRSVAIFQLVAPPDGNPGNGVLHYELHVTNTGGSPAKNVIVHDFINADTSSTKPIDSSFEDPTSIKLNDSALSSTVLVTQHFVLKDGAGHPLATGANAFLTRAIDFYLGDIPAHADWKISYDVVAKNAGSHKPDPIGTLISTRDYWLTSTSQLQVIAGSPRESLALVAAPVTLSIAAPTSSKSTVFPGEDFFYQLQPKNTGAINASKVELTFALPAGLIFEGFYDIDGTTPLDAREPSNPAIGKGGTFKFLVGNLGANSHGILNVKVRLIPDSDTHFPAAYRATTASFDFQVSSITGGYTLTNHTATGFQTRDLAETFVAAAAAKSDTCPVHVGHALQAQLFMGKFAPMATQENSPLAYTLFFGNSGNDTAKGVTVAIQAPSGTDYASSVPVGVYNKAKKTVTWTIGDLPAHTAKAVVLNVTVKQDTGTLAENSAVINATNCTGGVAGPMSTTVSANSFFGHVHEMWNGALGAMHIHLGAAANDPAVQADFQTLNGNSQYITMGGAAAIILKNGPFIIPMGPIQGVGQVLVGGPANAIRYGTDLVTGQPIKLVAGSGGVIDVNDVGYLNGDAIVTAVKKVHGDMGESARSLGNVVIGGPNLISNDGTTIKHNDTGAGAGTIGAVSGTAVISNDGHSLISNDGAGLISNDGAGAVAAGTGSLIPSNVSGIIGENGSGLNPPTSGGQVVVTNGGNVTSMGSGFISHNGSALVGNAGGTLIGNAGGALVGNAGGTLTSVPNSEFISHNGSALLNEHGAAIISDNSSGFTSSTVPKESGN